MENNESNIDLEMVKNCTSTIFSKTTRLVANAIIETVNDLFAYRPLTVRQVYYQLVAKGLIPNNQNHYRRVSRLLVKLRENDLVPWHLIEDRSRRTTDKRGYSDVQAWLREKMDYFDPKYYGRCYVQKQNVYVEVSTEKDALASIMENELWIYCTRLNVVRGQVSATFIEQMSQRFDAAVMRDQQPILLHFGDLDPSGISIPKAIKKNLLERHDIDVDVRHVALTPEQVIRFELPNSIDAVKKTDPNHKKWLEEFGSKQVAVELDALHPEELKQLLRTALHDTYNIDSFTPEMNKEAEERYVVSKIRADILDLLWSKYDIALNMAETE